MEFYATLICIIVIITLLGFALNRRLKDPLQIILIFVLYYWSLHGAWVVIGNALGYETRTNFLYLYSKIITITLSKDYLICLIYYGIFICTILITNLFLCKKRVWNTINHKPTILINSKYVIIVCSIAFIVSIFLVKDPLLSSIRDNYSAYALTRSNDYNFNNTLYQILIRVVLFPLTILSVIIYNGDSNRYIRAEFKNQKLTKITILLLLSSVIGVCMLLGNKNELLATVILGTSVYLTSNKEPKKRKLSLAVLLSLIILGFIDAIRVGGLSTLINFLDPIVITNSTLKILDSNETIGSHISMYAVLAKDIEPTLGASFISLIASVIPRVLWPDRPLDVYHYYAESIDVVRDQGYSIHHATGWYLNFGILGVIIGAFIISLVYSKLYNINYHDDIIKVRHNKFISLIYIFGSSCFISGIPNLLRTGPQAYKGLLIDSFIIPIFVLFFCLKQKN